MFYKRYYFLLKNFKNDILGHTKMEVTDEKIKGSVFINSYLKLQNPSFYICCSDNAKPFLVKDYKNIVAEKNELSKSGINIVKIDSVIICDNDKIACFGSANQAFVPSQSLISLNLPKKEIEGIEVIKEEKVNKIEKNAEKEIIDIPKIAMENNDIKMENNNIKNEKIENEFTEKKDITKSNDFFEEGDFGFDWSEVSGIKFPENSFVKKIIMSSLILNFVWHYGYYLYGVNKNNKNIIAFAIPSYYGLDPYPFIFSKNIGIWVSEKDCKSLYGDFGYFIIVLDIEKNKFIKIV